LRWNQVTNGIANNTLRGKLGPKLRFIVNSVWFFSGTYFLTMDQKLFRMSSNAPLNLI